MAPRTLTKEEIDGFNFMADKIKEIIQGGKATPLEVINEAMIYMRDENGHIDNANQMAIMALCK